MKPSKHTETSYHNLLEDARAKLDIARVARNQARANWRSFIVSHFQTPVPSKHSSQEPLLPKKDKAIDAVATFGPGATSKISVSAAPAGTHVPSPLELYNDPLHFF